MTVADRALDHLLRLAALQRPAGLVMREQPPAMKTLYHAEEAAAAAIAAGAAEAAAFAELRGWPAQSIDIAPREAAAALTSYTHMRFLEPERAPPSRDAQLARAAAFGFHKAKDGRFIYLHPSFPPSTEKLLRLLACAPEREAIAAAASRWNALDLENAIAEAGVCGALCRSPQEWDESEQGRILAARPVVEVVKLADSPPEAPAHRGEAALSGVRVLDLTRVLAGPTCARTLASYGADVMAITSPDLPSAPMFVADTGHGKLSASLNLQQPADREKLADLVKQSDVFSQGYRAGALARLGFGPLELARLRPGVVVVEINCYGHEGPWRNRPGWEQLAQTVTGMAYEHGGAESPLLQPGAVTDYTTGYLAAFGAITALRRRALYGGSYLVRASLCQTGMWVRSWGRAAPAKLEALAPNSEADIASYTVESETGFGRLRHLRPPVALSHTPAQWRRSTRPLGVDPPAWPPS